MTNSFAAILALSFMASVVAQPDTHDSLAIYEGVLAARRERSSGDFAAAEARLRAAFVQRPQDGVVAQLWADTLRRLGRFDEAIVPYRRAMQLGSVDEADGHFLLACCHAGGGESALALEQLRAALSAGYRWRPRLGSDRRLSSLRGEPGFDAIAGDAVTHWPRDEGLRRDLDFLESEISRAHWRFRHRPLPASTVAAIAHLRAKIPTMSDSQVTVGFQQVLASLGDGHSVLHPFGMRVGELGRVPLDLYFFSDGLFVTGAAARYRHLIGHRVVAFGEVDAWAALEAMRPWVSCDNDQSLRWLGPIYLTFPAYHVAAGLAATAEELRISLQDAEGKAEMVSIGVEPFDPRSTAMGLVAPGVPGGPSAPRHLRSLEEPFWMEPLGGGTTYVQVNRVLNSRTETLAGFAGRLQQALATNESKAVVLDLRHNPGGEGALGRALVRVLMHFEAAAEGRVVVLIGRNTFSAAQTLVSDLDWWTNAVFIGEPTGSRPSRVGNEAPFALPYSGCRGILASGYHSARAAKDAVWVAPDVFVPLSAVDYFAGRDPVLDVTLKWLDRDR